jgi:ABC-type nitrate/sulfonate/bicarbonate transport system substrate-binding protein
MSPPGKNLKYALGGVIILVVFLLALLVVFSSSPPTRPVQEELLTIAIGTPEPSLLTLIAEDQGYFKKYGLNVTIREYPAGAYAMKELLAGNADLASAAEFVGVANSFQYKDLRIITTTAKIDNIFLIIRTDRGIAGPSDLKGKTIAVPKGTAAEFILGRYLTLNGMDPSAITIRYLAPADVITSVVSGESDAAVIWDPYASRIEQQLGRNSTTWNAQGGQLYYWVTYTRADVIRDRPEMIRKYLHALDDAETFLSTQSPEAKEIVRRRLMITEDSPGRFWNEYRFGLLLDQALIVEMEDESRWMTEQNMTGGRTPPSYLDLIEQAPMREVRPSAVTIIR